MEYNTPYQHAMYTTRSCLVDPFWDNKDKLAALEGIVPALVSRVDLERVCFVTSDYPPKLHISRLAIDLFPASFARRPLVGKWLSLVMFSSCDRFSETPVLVGKRCVYVKASEVIFLRKPAQYTNGNGK